MLPRVHILLVISEGILLSVFALMIMLLKRLLADFVLLIHVLNKCVSCRYFVDLNVIIHRYFINSYFLKGLLINSP